MASSLVRHFCFPFSTSSVARNLLQKANCKADIIFGSEACFCVSPTFRYFQEKISSHPFLYEFPALVPGLAAVEDAWVIN